MRLRAHSGWGLLTLALIWHSIGATEASAQVPLPDAPAAPGAPSPPAAPAADAEEEIAPPAKVEVTPQAFDAQIADRLYKILVSTGWFEDPSVTVTNGVVFLSGTTSRESYQKWAGTLAQQTRDVVAVVNKIEVTEGPLVDFAPAWQELRSMGRWTIQKSPLFAIGILVFIASWFAMHGAASLTRRILARRQKNELLRDVTARVVAVPIFLLGIYLVFQIAGLTRLAATLLGGTGLIGLVIGIAFRDITENFLASLLISAQSPFRVGDVINVNGQTGVVQKVTVRGTLLMDFSGAYIQIPNSIMYKSVIYNYSANAVQRQETVLSLPPETPIERAQEALLTALRDHPVVRTDPEPLILVEKLVPTLDVRLIYWLDVKEHSAQKVLSSVLRSARRVLAANGVFAPEPESAAQNGAAKNGRPKTKIEPLPPVETAKVRNAAEGNLNSEAADVQAQAERSPSPEEGENLLKPGRN